MSRIHDTIVKAIESKNQVENTVLKEAVKTEKEIAVAAAALMKNRTNSTKNSTLEVAKQLSNSSDFNKTVNASTSAKARLIAKITQRMNHLK